MAKPGGKSVTKCAAAKQQIGVGAVWVFPAGNGQNKICPILKTDNTTLCLWEWVFEFYMIPDHKILVIGLKVGFKHWSFEAKTNQQMYLVF